MLRMHISIGDIVKPEEEHMIEMYLFEQLDVAAKHGTLLAASERLHITQPSISWAMKKLEDVIGIELFEHKATVSCSTNTARLLPTPHPYAEAQQADDPARRLRTRTALRVPVDPLLSTDQTLSTEVRDEKTLLNGLREGVYPLIILIHKPDVPKSSAPCGSEQLCVC